MKSLVCLAAFAATISPLTAQCLVQETVALTPAGTSPGDQFGGSIASFGDRLLVGAPGANRAYLYEMTPQGWTEVLQLAPSDGIAGDRFGESVILGDDLAVVGAPERDQGAVDAGAVYVYRFGALIEETKLVGPPVTNSSFGFSLALHEGTLVVGSEDGGLVRIYQRTPTQALVLQQELTGSALARFGYSIALSDNLLAVGSPYDSGLSSREGKVDVFRFDGSNWGLEAGGITASQPQGQFGVSVALQPGVLLVGSCHCGTGTGRFFALSRSGPSWNMEAEILQPDAVNNSEVFGRYVVFDGANAVVSAFNHDAGTGAAYVYQRRGGQWTHTLQLLAGDAVPGDHFGRFLAFDGSGAAWVASTEHGGGKVYRFDQVTHDIQLGASPALAGVGDTVHLAACGGVALSPTALFVVSANGLPFFAFVMGGAFDAAGQWNLFGQVPDVVQPGTSIGLRCYGIRWSGGIGSSAEARIAFQ